MLVTSREPLHVDGEWEVAVNPLQEREAVDLFVQRALAVSSDFAANGEVAEICRRLDCLPLAIELAAARVKALSPRSCSTGSSIGCPCSPEALARHPSGSARCARRSPGATTY